VRSSWVTISEGSWPDIGPLALAVVLLGVGQVLIGEAFVVVGPNPPAAADRRWAFHLTQPAKYIPGGIAQPAGLVTVLMRRGASSVATAMSYVVIVAALVIAGISLGLVLSPALEWWLPIIAAGLVLPFLLLRPVLVIVVRLAARIVPVNRPEEQLPAQGSLLRCLTGCVIGVGLHACAYAVLVDAVGGDTAPMASVASYSLAAGVSIATPLPGGLGAREALLIGLADLTGSASLLAIALIRVLLIGVEIILGLLASARIRRPGERPAAG